jgi:very-short-patch-repair endonuclease
MTRRGLSMTEDELAAYQRKLSGKPKPAAPAPQVVKESALERRFYHQLLEAKFVEGPGMIAPWFLRQYAPIEGRNYVCDFGFPQFKLIVEVQGNVHRVKGQFYDDIRKKIALLLAGWKVLELTRREIVDSSAGIEAVQQLTGYRVPK